LVIIHYGLVSNERFAVKLRKLVLQNLNLEILITLSSFLIADCVPKKLNTVEFLSCGT